MIFMRITYNEIHASANFSYIYIYIYSKFVYEHIFLEYIYMLEKIPFTYVDLVTGMLPSSDSASILAETQIYFPYNRVYANARYITTR